MAESYYESEGDLNPTSNNDEILINSKQNTWFDEDSHFGDINFYENAAYQDDNYDNSCKYIYFGFQYSSSDVNGTVGNIRGEITYTCTDGFKTFINSKNEYKEILTYFDSPDTYDELIVAHEGLSYGKDFNWLPEYSENSIPGLSKAFSTGSSEGAKHLYLFKRARDEYYQVGKTLVIKVIVYRLI